MAINATTLRPGFLVVIKTSNRGNATYNKQGATTERKGEAEIAEWQTTRTILDAKEHEAACKVRSAARAMIASVCVTTPFGMLCPMAAATELELAIREARKAVADFNAVAKVSRIGVYVMTGRIEPNDTEAVKMINSEVRDLFDQMEEGVKNLEVKQIRNAAAKAKEIGAMLSPDMQARVQVAIDAARATATKIVKAGSTAAAEIDRRTITTLKEMRTAFLDLGEGGEDVEVTTSAPKQARAIELPEDLVVAKRPVQPALDLDGEE
jgi:hypothetical protein